MAMFTLILFCSTMGMTTCQSYSAQQHIPAKEADKCILPHFCKGGRKEVSVCPPVFTSVVEILQSNAEHLSLVFQ